MNEKRKMPATEISKRADFFLLYNKKVIAKIKINKAIIISMHNTKRVTPDLDYREEAKRINLGR